MDVVGDVEGNSGTFGGMTEPSRGLPAAPTVAVLVSAMAIMFGVGWWARGYRKDAAFYCFSGVDESDTAFESCHRSRGRCEEGLRDERSHSTNLTLCTGLESAACYDDRKIGEQCFSSMGACSSARDRRALMARYDDKQMPGSCEERR